MARWLLLLVVLAVVGFNAAIVLKGCLETPARLVDHAGATLERVAAAFNRGTLTTSFVSYATTVTNQLLLQVATLRQMEMFERKQEASTGFGYIPLPDIVVEARAPVEYTYHVDLRGAWRVTVQGQNIQVQAPPIEFNKPAVDASAISYEVRKGYFKTDQALAALKQSITSMVADRARDNIPLVRENARHQVETFVQTWLVKAFLDAKDYAVDVRFADEPPGAGDRGPAVRLP